MEIIFAIAFTAILLWLNIKATLIVRRDSLLSAVQTFSQIGIVWLCPLLGAILIEQPLGAMPQIAAVHARHRRGPGRHEGNHA